MTDEGTYSEAVDHLQSKLIQDLEFKDASRSDAIRTEREPKRMVAFNDSLERGLKSDFPLNITRRTLRLGFA